MGRLDATVDLPSNNMMLSSVVDVVIDEIVDGADVLDVVDGWLPIWVAWAIGPL